MDNVGNSKSNDGKKQLPTDKPMAGGGEPEASDGSFFIAGLCASAGGLEAFEEFFKNLPPDTGMGFVIVSHLDPTKKDIMPDLVQRIMKFGGFTTMEAELVARKFEQQMPDDFEAALKVERARFYDQARQNYLSTMYNRGIIPYQQYVKN